MLLSVVTCLKPRGTLTAEGPYGIARPVMPDEQLLTAGFQYYALHFRDATREPRNSPQRGAAGVLSSQTLLETLLDVHSKPAVFECLLRLSHTCLNRAQHYSHGAVLEVSIEDVVSA